MSDSTHGAELVGTSIEVEHNGGWRFGRVASFDESSGTFLVKYGNGQQQVEPLNDPEFAWCEVPLGKRPADEPDPPPAKRPASTPPISDDDEEEDEEDSGGEEVDEDVYSVEKIVGQKGGKFLVRWAGFDASHDSWEPKANILDDELIAAFRQERDERDGGARAPSGGSVCPDCGRGFATLRGLKIHWANNRRCGAPGSSDDDVEDMVEVEDSTERRSGTSPPGGSVSVAPPVVKAGAKSASTGQHPLSATRGRRESAAAPAPARAEVRSTSADAVADASRRQPKRAAATAAMSAVANSMKPSLLTGAKYRRAFSRVGAQYQAPAQPMRTPSVLAPPAPPPLCRCDKPAVWEQERWWCATGPVGGCAYEAPPPPQPTSPLCACARPAVWYRDKWWCDASTQDPKGCGFRARDEVASGEPTARTHKEVAAEAAAETAALLTACAMGPLGDFAFIAQSDCGRGLFARDNLPIGLAIAECARHPTNPTHSPSTHHPYIWPRVRPPYLAGTVGPSYIMTSSSTATMPWASLQRASSLTAIATTPRGPRAPCRARAASTPTIRASPMRALRSARCPTRGHMISSTVRPLPDPRTLTHDAFTNTFYRWHCSMSGAWCCIPYVALGCVSPYVAAGLVLIASERIPRGGEVRLDYDRQHASYDYWSGKPPPETPWREKRAPAPPPSGADCVPGANQPVPDAEIRAELNDVAIPWEGANGGDARIILLEPMLKPTKSDRRWACAHSPLLLSLCPCNCSPTPRAELRTLSSCRCPPSLPPRAEPLPPFHAMYGSYVATHLPGRTGLECRDRFAELEARGLVPARQASPPPNAPPPPPSGVSAGGAPKKKPVTKGAAVNGRASVHKPAPPPAPPPAHPLTAPSASAAAAAAHGPYAQMPAHYGAYPHMGPMGAHYASFPPPMAPMHMYPPPSYQMPYPVNYAMAPPPTLGPFVAAQQPAASQPLATQPFAAEPPNGGAAPAEAIFIEELD